MNVSRVIVKPGEGRIAAPGAHEAFNPDRSLIDPKQQAAVEGLGHTLVSFLRKLNG